MPSKTYAILGATGQTGSEIVKALLPTTNHLNIYARSLPRLESTFPNIKSATNVTLFIGSLDNTDLLASCLANADVVLSTVAQNRNEPNLSVAQQTALAIIKALESERSKGRVPTVVFLSSGAIMPEKNQEIRYTWAQGFFHWCIYWVYTDLEKSLELFKANPWIPVVVAAASGLVHDIGHEVELVDDKELASGIESYTDLAKGMIMMGDQGDKWHGKHVGMYVNGGKKIGGSPVMLLRYLGPNLLAMDTRSDWWVASDEHYCPRPVLLANYDKPCSI